MDRVPTNMISSGQFDKLASTLLTYYPAPTNSSTVNNYVFSGVSRLNSRFVCRPH